MPYCAKVANFNIVPMLYIIYIDVIYIYIRVQIALLCKYDCRAL